MNRILISTTLELISIVWFHNMFELLEIITIRMYTAQNNCNLYILQTNE